MKQVKISEELFNRLYDFFENLEIYSILTDLLNLQVLQEYEVLGTELRKKYDAMKLREAFSAYKATSDPERREQLRREYLDQAEIPEGFRTSKEVDSEFL